MEQLLLCKQNDIYVYVYAYIYIYVYNKYLVQIAYTRNEGMFLQIAKTRHSLHTPLQV
jgi:hypothetical protein